MKLLFVNSAKAKVSRIWVADWLKRMSRVLAKEFGYRLSDQELVVAIVSEDEMRRLNKTFRGQNKPTDILSFESAEPQVVGELVVCIEEIKANAKQSKLTHQQELGYMLIHGVLHLLGFDHNTKRAEKRMFAMQDLVFENLNRR